MMTTVKMNQEQVLERIRKIGIIPAMRTSDSHAAIRAADAIFSGGIPIIEISMTQPEALEVLRAVAKERGGEMLIGAGTVVNVEVAHRTIDAGANFVVTTGFNSLIVEKCAKLGLFVFAGAMTPTEIELASTAGPAAVKLFPCNATGGPRYVRTIRGQYPNTELIASGGVTLENCAEYFQAGAFAVGVGAEIMDSESLAAGNQRFFTERAKRFRRAITEAQERWCVTKTLIDKSLGSYN